MNLAVAVLEAASAGSVSGSIIWFVIAAASGSPLASGWELFLIPVLILTMSLVAMFVLLPAIVLVGIPLAFLLREHSGSMWVPVCAVAAGGLAGWIAAILISLDLPFAGQVYGAAAGLFWYLRARLVMVRINEDKQCTA